MHTTKKTPNPAQLERAVREMATDLLHHADAWGLVLTIEQRPLMPLAMGNYAPVVSVRPKRELAAPAAPAKANEESAAC